MLSQKYIKDFLNTNNNKDFKAVLERIIDQEKMSKISFLEWSEKEIGEYLRSFNSISPMALNRQFSILRNFSDYICEGEGISKRNFSLSEDRLYDFIDRDKLLQVTINYEQYKNIKNQLDVNIRDKLIFELAWCGLTNDEIKMLKISDIKFEKSEDYECAFIEIGKEFPHKIEDPEVVEDIKESMKRIKHINKNKNGKENKYSYRYSEYLIKPANVGRTKKEGYACNPSTYLKDALDTNEVICEEIEISDLSIENIRRSGLIYLLSPENEKDYSLVLITVLYGYKNENGLFWLKNFAKEKYKS